jgi:hypothetical protein
MDNSIQPMGSAVAVEQSFPGKLFVSADVSAFAPPPGVL